MDDLSSDSGALDAASRGPGNTRAYVVQRRDTLWSIAETQLGDPLRWPELAQINPRRRRTSARLHDSGRRHTDQANGDLANWAVPGALVKGMGGAMDLVAGTKRIVVLTDHVAKDGSPKIVAQCHLPLTGLGVVNRIITDRAIFDVTHDGLILRRLSDGETVEGMRKVTNAPFAVEVGEHLG